MKQPMKPRGSAFGRRRTTVVAMLLALALAALRCSVDVPLGVDPNSDAADNQTDGGVGN
jgi:hypothetical protein